MTARRPAPGSNRAPGDGGVASVEFALVVPLLVALIYIAVLAGSVYTDQMQIQSAARNGARVGSVVPASACPTIEQELATNSVGAVRCELLKTCAGGTVQVRVTAVQHVSIPLVGDKTVTLRASSSYTCTP